jgi:predicted GNAT family acetyltransferase
MGQNKCGQKLLQKYSHKKKGIAARLALAAAQSAQKALKENGNMDSCSNNREEASGGQHMHPEGVAPFC